MGDDHFAARIPVSTYRLQFNCQFRFSDAKRIISYLNELGITDIYSSPYFKARAGSLHGYDIVEHGMLNPEIGSMEEYYEMGEELKKHGMGQILDIVPNHMCIASKENVWWIDVLENGPGSMYADFFDIDWEPVKKELKEKVLIPVLGNQYGNILEKQEMRLIFENGAFFINYFAYKFPVIPKTYIDILQYRIAELENLLSRDNPFYVELLSIITALNHLPFYTEKETEKIAERYREKEIIKKRLWALYNESSDVRLFIDENVKVFNGVKDDSKSFDPLDNILDKQAYRLSYWRVATDEINYRRFFDVNELAAIRIENQNVFNKVHELVFRLIREGSVSGLRVDHPDGLYNPSEYFKSLQKNCFLSRQLYLAGSTGDSHVIEEDILRQYDELLQSNPHMKPFYIIGEKILIKGERIPEDWQIFSTTGYAFLNSLNGIFIDTENADAFDEIYCKAVKSEYNFQDTVYEKKKLIMNVAMSSEINTLGHILNRISEKNRHTRDFTLNSLINAIKEVIAFFPVYRTYITEKRANERDHRYIEIAVSRAKKKNPAISESIYDFLRDVLLLNYPEGFSDDYRKEWIDFAMRFQQITGPVMAKGVEDTAFYVYNRLISLNEVGGSPDRFGTPIETFHGQNIERSKFWPNALIATSTHDTKRSEDVRARINVLSELPDEWRRYIVRWSRINKGKKSLIDNQPVPDSNEEYLLYQTLIGVWPMEEMDDSGLNIFIKRIKDYMLKAAREAKVNTSWISPNTIYENALMSFIEKILVPLHNSKFLKDFLPFQKMVSHFGIFNSLSQTLLKIASPGVPDFYQGTEIWDLSLVDPDNRRPVDYDKRIEMMKEIKLREMKIPMADLARELTIEKNNGKIKLYLASKTLDYRRGKRGLFENGEYMPLDADGEKKRHICAFAKKEGDSIVIVIVPRLIKGLMQKTDSLPFGEEVWRDTFIILPFGIEGGRYRNIFTGEISIAEKERGVNTLKLAGVFKNFPVSLLELTI